MTQQMTAEQFEDWKEANQFLWDYLENCRLTAVESLSDIGIKIATTTGSEREKNILNARETQGFIGAFEQILDLSYENFAGGKDD
jgi:hypothetical protein